MTTNTIEKPNTRGVEVCDHCGWTVPVGRHSKISNDVAGKTSPPRAARYHIIM